MFSLGGACFLIFLHPFVLAVLIPETSGSILYSEPIDIVYRNDRLITDKISALIRLENPLKCMNWANLKYSPTGDIVSSTKTGKVHAHMKIELKLLKMYNNTKIYIFFYTAESTLLEKHILFNLHHSYLRGLNEKHECLNHCTIIFNIKEVFKHLCEDNSPYKDVCCESNESSSPPLQPALDPETNTAKDRGLDEKHKCLEHCTVIYNIEEFFKKYYEYNHPLKYDCCKSTESSSPPLQPALDPETDKAKDREIASLKSELKSLMLPLETEVKAFKHEFLDIKESLEFLKSKFEEINSKRLHNETEIEQLSSSACSKTPDVDTMQRTNSSAVLIPETSEIIHFSERIYIHYRLNETVSAQFRLENPLKCMTRVDILEYPTHRLLASQILADKFQTYNMNIQLKLDRTPVEPIASIVIAFFNQKKHLVSLTLVELYYLNSRYPNEKHECLKHCTITYDIKENLTKLISKRILEEWCESIESSPKY